MDRCLPVATNQLVWAPGWEDNANAAIAPRPGGILHEYRPAA